MSARPLTQSERRLNAGLTLVLGCVAFWLLNAIARDRLDVRRDFSADRLYDVAPLTRELLAGLEDVLQVQAYFTGEAQHGPVQIAKRQLLLQLEELERVAGGQMHVSFLDPNRSTAARVDALDQGLIPAPIQAVQGTSAITQEVWLGMVLRYRGRDWPIPFTLPQTFESMFVTGLDRLTREREVVVGFVGQDASLPTIAPSLHPGWSEAQRLIGREREVRTLRGLAEGVPVPEDVDVLVVPGPLELHPRVVFEIDAFARRGGRVLLTVDQVRVAGARVVNVSSGVEKLLGAWGAPLLPGHLWDHGSSNALRMRTGGSLQYPYWVRVTEDGLDDELPAVARLRGADFFWAHEIDQPELPPGVRRTVLARTTERSWRVEPIANVAIDASDLEVRAAELLAAGGGEPRAIAVALAGALGSPWEAVPAPRDGIEEAVWAGRVAKALKAGDDPPGYPLATTDEEIPRGAVAQVVVVGDADWMADGETFTDRNRMLLANLVDWLALDDEFRDLRVRQLRDRPITNFLAEEREALGVGVLEGSSGWERAAEVSRLESQAQERAERRRWWTMLTATGGGLLALVLAGLAGRWALARGVAWENRA